MKDLIQKVRENWNQIDEKANIEPLSIGATNTVFRVHSSQIFYLRKYRTRNIEHITREHKLLDRLTNNLKVIIAPVLACDGDTFSQFDGDIYALFPEAQGRLVEKSELSELHAYQLGKTLASLHIELASISGKDFPTIELSWDKHAWIDRLRKIATAIEANSKLDTNGLMLKRVKQQSRYLESSKAIHSYTPSTSRQLIHGDFHHFNVFFDSSGAVSDIIDWDLYKTCLQAMR
jgi:Ser/Thr protein kinase RdoA (MazF antagonist)